MDWKRLVEFALLGSADIGTVRHPVGARFDRTVLRHLWSQQVVCRRRYEAGL